MASPVVNIDPYGEVFIVIPTAVTRSKAGLANEEIIAPLERVEGQDGNSLPADRSENDDSDKDPAHVKAKQQSSFRLRVSKKHLIMSSVRAKKMYEMNCKESTPDENGNFHWHFEPIFNCQAFKMVMDIIHGQTHKTPDSVGLDMMANVAAITDDLQCHNAVKFVADTWIERLPGSPPKKICSDLYKWILVAWVFDQPDLFQSATSLAIMDCAGTLSPGVIPINPAIIEAVESMRVELLSELIAGVESIRDKLSRGHSTCTFECRSMLLGALIQEMRSNGLSSPDPSELKQDLSLNTTLGIIRKFQSPVIFSPRSKFADVANGYENYDPNTLWKLQWGPDEDNSGCSFSEKSKIHKKAVTSVSFWQDDEEHDEPETLFKHQCSLHTLLKPCLRAIEAKVVGLDISSFCRAG